MKKIWILCVFVCFHCVVYGQKNMVKFDKDTIGFLPCQAGEMLNALFTFTNNSKDTIIIEKAAGTCKCLTTEFNNRKIAPGGCGYVLLHYDSKGEFGPFLKQFTMVTNRGLYNAYIQGEIVNYDRPLTNLSFAKKVYSAGIIKGRSSKDYVIKFDNRTAVPVFIKGIGVKGTVFDIDYDKQIDCCGKKKLYYKKIVGIDESGEIVVHLDNKKGKLHGPQTTQLLIWANVFDAPMIITVKSDFE